MQCNNFSETIIYNYKFVFPDSVTKEFEIILDHRTLNLIQNEKSTYPDWTLLDYYKCSNCPLSQGLQNYCPTAAGMTELIDSFQCFASYERVKVEFTSTERTCIKDTSLQEALSSLTGIYMVTGGCPVMKKLKPLVRFHLPFATDEETTFRVMSMYLVAQYFLYRQGKHADWDLKNLAKIYDDIRVVNRCFSKRLANINIEDSSINALVNLDCFADGVLFNISGAIKKDFASLFDACL